jgi:hypothetical protein
MTDDEYGKLAERQVKALEKSMDQFADTICKRHPEYNALTPPEQEFVKQWALANAGSHFGGFNKPEKNT